MKSFTYTITDPIGLHARPAGLLVKEAKKYASSVTVRKDGKSCDATKLMMLMGLCIRDGDDVVVEVTGDDEETAIAELETFFKTNL